MSTTLNPRTTQYEFLGPPGAFLVSLALPTITYLLYFGCSEVAGCRPSLISVPQNVVDAIVDPNWGKSLWDTKATIAYLAWYALCVLAWAILPGGVVDGTTLRNGRRKQYTINAFSTLLLALGVTSGTILRYGPDSFTFIYKHWVGLITASMLMAFVQATYCYITSLGEGKLLALGGNSGNFLYDWFIGRELNPSLGSFDLKSFNELRPGLILWVLIDVSMVCEQATRRGGLGQVTQSLWLVLAFHGWYVADALYNERISAGRFHDNGHHYRWIWIHVAIGNLMYVPFAYSLQARYLAFHPVELSPIAIVGIIGVNLLGYYIFRTANGEKNDFRNGKNPKNLKYMVTKKGSKLLTSGWWGRSRHPNYIGDLIMALAWSLPTGFETPITYYYVIYFTILLIHRQRRDEEACSKKYGADWEIYKKLVPYRIIPYIY